MSHRPEGLAKTVTFEDVHRISVTETYFSHLTVLMLFCGFAGLLWTLATLRAGNPQNFRFVDHLNEQALAPSSPFKPIYVLPAFNVDSGKPNLMPLIADLKLHFQDLHLKHFLTATVGQRDDYVYVTLDSSEIFRRGQAEFARGAGSDITTLAKAMLYLKPTTTIDFVGYTDSEPVRHARFTFPTNWELSAARAGRILREFESIGFDSSSLTLVGYGSTRQKVADRTPSGELISENAIQNRRVEIRVRPK